MPGWSRSRISDAPSPWPPPLPRAPDGPGRAAGPGRVPREPAGEDGGEVQCGEATGDGGVFEADYEAIFDLLAGKIENPLIRARCSVAGTTECNIRDLVFLKKALDGGAMSVERRCDAALSPAGP